MDCNLIRNSSFRPAQAVLDKIACAMAQRRADETREELEEVLKRIEIINANYELSQSLTYRSKPDMFECFSDLKELEELLKDQFKRKKFQDKVTIFVVGCRANIAENVTLLQQVNDFFATSLTDFDDDFKSLETDDLDIRDMSSTMQETLETTESLINRLGEINRDLVQCLTQLEQKKTAKGRKKLEMALQQTKDDATKLNETLHRLQQGMQEKEERVHQLVMQLDLKNKELLKLNSSAVAEATKRYSLEVDDLKSVISNRDRQISQLEADVRRLEKELASVIAKFAAQFHQHPSSLVEPEVEFVPSSSTSSSSYILQQHLPHSGSTAKASDESTESNEDAENKASCEATETPDNNEPRMTMEGFASTGSPDMLEIKCKNGGTEIVIQKESKEDLVSRYHPFVKDAAKLTVGAQVAPSQGVTVRSNDSRTNNKSRHISKVPRRTSNSKQDFGPSHSTSGQSSDSSLSVPGIGLSDARKSLSALPEEEIQQLNKSLDLKDEEAWSGYSLEELPLRFKQYRTLALNRISELEDQLEVTIRKTCNKVDSLKQQFEDQRQKWEAKQKSLVDGLKQMHTLQSEADQDIGLALTHLEGTVNIHDDQVKDNNSVKRDDLWPLTEDMSQSQLAQDAGDSEINLKEETGFVEPDRLEKMTDDAKVQMSRESTKISYEATKDPLLSELSITDEQQTTEDEQILYDVKPSATILSEMVDESTSPLNLTWSSVDMDERRETLLAIRQRMEDRLVKTNLFVVSSDFARASPHDEQDIDNEGQVLDGDREGQRKIMRSQGTSPAEFINELSTDTLQPLQISPATVLEDYLKTYDDIFAFQQNLANYLPINTSSVDRVIFNKSGPLKSQIALLSQSINKMPAKAKSQEPAYSQSLAKWKSGKQNTSSNVIDQKNSQHSIHNKSLEVDGHLEVERVVSPAENMEDTELRTEYIRLAKALEQEKKLHRDQFHHNSALVSEMQDTIGNLKRELSTLRVKANGITQHHLQPPPSPSDRGDPIIFTRLDSERNVKIMRKAIVEQRISVDRCKAVLHRMKRYVDLPGQRLQHLARTYVQHKNLLEIQENLRSDDGIDSDLLGLLAKMESYQKKRLEKCDEKSQALTQERARLAKELVEILSNIELESGIFLIKPVYSYKGSNDPEQSSQRKRTRLNQPNQSVKRQLQPHTPPISMTTDGPVKQPLSINCPAMSVKSTDQLENGVQGTAKQLIGEPTRPVWKQSESTADQMIDSRSQPSIPHLLELDVNRVLIGNNNISVKLHPNSSSALSTSSATRSYVAASRPNGSAIPHRAASIAGLNSVPPSTPALYGSKTESEGGKLFNSSSRMSPTPGGPSLITTPPLPPIPSSKADDCGTNVSPAGASITRRADEEDPPADSTD